MKKTWHWLRGPCTTQEKRAYYDHPELVRAKRRPSNLANSWDDIPHAIQKTWKVKRKKQHRGRSKLQEFNFQAGVRFDDWGFKEYCEDKNIPFKIKPIYKTKSYKRRIVKRVKDRYVPYYVNHWTISGYIVKHQAGWRWTYKNILTDQYETCRYNYIVGYNVTYWFNKQLDFRKFYYGN